MPKNSWWVSLQQNYFNFVFWTYFNNKKRGFGTVYLVYLVEDTKYKEFALKKVKCDNKNELENLSKENKYYRQLNNHPNLG